MFRRCCRIVKLVGVARVGKGHNKVAAKSSPRWLCLSSVITLFDSIGPRVDFLKNIQLWWREDGVEISSRLHLSLFKYFLTKEQLIWVDDDVHYEVTQFIKLNRYDEKFVVRTGVSCQKHPHRIRGCTKTTLHRKLHQNDTQNFALMQVSCTLMHEHNSQQIMWSIKPMHRSHAWLTIQIRPDHSLSAHTCRWRTSVSIVENQCCAYTRGGCQLWT